MHNGDFLAVLSAVFWSSSVILMRVAGYQIPPVPLIFFKNSIAIIGFAAILLYTGESLLPELSENEHFRLIISSVLGIALADTMISAALNRLGASLQALADCVYSPAIAIVGFLMFGEILDTWEILGGVLVLSGVLTGARITAEVKNQRDLITGITLAAVGHIIMAVGILLIRDIYREHSVAWVCGYRFIIANVVLVICAVVRKNKEDIFLGFRRIDTWKTMIPMAIFGPYLATICWVSGFKYLKAGRAAIYNQLSTVFITILAFLILKEKFTTRKAIGITLALLGSILIATH